MSASADQDSFEAEALRLTNEALSHSRRCGGKKTKKKVRPLSWNATYTPSGVSPFQRMRSAGYNYRAAGEKGSGKWGVYWTQNFGTRKS